VSTLFLTPGNISGFLSSCSTADMCIRYSPSR